MILSTYEQSHEENIHSTNVLNSHFFQLLYLSKQNRSTGGCSKLKRSVDMTNSGKNGLNIRTNASPKWEGPGVRRREHPLLASRIRCNVLWQPPKFGNKVKIGNQVQFGKKFANW